MANPLLNEKELYAKIKNEKITVPLPIWDLMYHYLGDEVSAITQITLSYWRYNEPVAVADAKRILDHTKKINAVVKKILHPEKDENKEGAMAELKNNPAKFHPVIKELFTHYIGNDVYGINMIVGFYIDPKDENPIPVEDAKKILNKTFTLKEFMDRLREATQQEVTMTGDKSA